MAKYTYTNSGITFNNVSSDGKQAFPNGHYNGNNDYAHIDTDPVQPFINAVEIDWNSATLGDKFINLFGEVGCSILVPFVC